MTRDEIINYLKFASRFFEARSNMALPGKAKELLLNSKNACDEAIAMCKEPMMRGKWMVMPYSQDRNKAPMEKDTP